MPDSVYVYGFETYKVPSGASTIERTISRLRNAIMRGEFKPGQKLVEADLCKRFEISRPSLREVLRTLASEQVINLVQNRGPSVAHLDNLAVEEIHDAWAVITSALVFDFTPIARDKDLKILSDALLALRLGLEKQDPLLQLDATNSFFRHILSRFNNAVLSEMVYGLVSRINFLRAQALNHHGWGALCVSELESIFDKVREGNAEQARIATRRHIDSACGAAKQVVAAQTLSAAKTSDTSKDDPAMKAAASPVS